MCKTVVLDIYHTELNLMHADDPEGWDGGGRKEVQQAGICVDILMIHFIVQQNLTIRKAITLQ